MGYDIYEMFDEKILPKIKDITDLDDLLKIIKEAIEDTSNIRISTSNYFKLSLLQTIVNIEKSEHEILKTIWDLLNYCSEKELINITYKDDNDAIINIDYSYNNIDCEQCNGTGIVVIKDKNDKEFKTVCACKVNKF
jgi:hypothetical protein